jgi:hypothetical protein
VVDTGVGIPASEMPLIFDRFYRGTELNEARSTGSGLGLSIVKSIVDLHHGTIVVESRAGHGSRFVVTLPKDPHEVTEVEPAVADLPAGPGAPTPPSMKPAPAHRANVDVSSPSRDPALNHDPAPLSGDSGQAEPVIHPTTRESLPRP